MIKAISWEARKALSTPVVWLIALGTALFCALLPAVTALNLTGMLADTSVQTEVDRLSTMTRFYTYSFTGRSGYFAPFLVGVLIATADFANGSLARSVMLIRNRLSVFAAKIIIVLAISTTIAVLAVAANFTSVAAILGNTENLVGGILPVEILLVGVRTVIVCLVWGLIGLGLGFLIRSQTLAVVTVFLFTLLLEPLLTSLANENESFGEFGRFLPGAANWAVVWPLDAPGGDATMGGMNGAALDVSTALMVLVAYAAAFLAAGYAVGLRRRELPV